MNNAAATGVDRLSAEVLSMVFAHLAPAQVLCARCVSRFWAAVALQVICARAARGGPLLHLQQGEPFPVQFSLPMFANARGEPATHPAVVLFDAVNEECPIIMARTLLPRLSRINTESCVWPASVLTSAAMPRLRHVAATSLTCHETELGSGCFAKVRSLHINCALNPLWRNAMVAPACERLSIEYCEKDPQRLGQRIGRYRRLRSLTLSDSEIDMKVLPKHLHELSLNNCTLAVHVTTDARTGPATAPAEPQRYFSMMKAFYGAQPYATGLVGANALDVGSKQPVDPNYAGYLEMFESEMAAAMCMPALQRLEVVSTRRAQQIRAPNLRELILTNTDDDFADVHALRSLETVSFTSMCRELDLAWLKDSVRSLILSKVGVPNLDFLRCVPALEKLLLDHVNVQHESAFPAHSVPRLRVLRIRGVGVDPGNRFSRATRITQLERIGELRRLEVLTLESLTLADLSFLADMPALKNLRLRHLDNVTALGGAQHAPALETLGIAALPSLRSVTVQKRAARLRRVIVRTVRLLSLNLSASHVTNLSLEVMQCERPLLLPAGLTRLRINECKLAGQATLDFLRPLTALRTLDYNAHDTRFDARHHAAWGSLPRLKSVTLRGRALLADALRGMSFDRLEVMLQHAPDTAADGWPARSLSAASLSVVLGTGACPCLDFVDPAVLRHMEFQSPQNAPGCRYAPLAPSLAPLAACPRLAYLYLNAPVSTLEDFRGHPSLEELRVRGVGLRVDIDVLATCTRLAVVDIQKCTVAESQYRSLREVMFAAT